MKMHVSGMMLSMACLMGCAPVGDVDDDGEQAQALGEAACGTVGGYAYSGAAANGRSQVMGANPFCSYASTVATSPSGTYTNAGCTNQFVSEVRGTLGRALSAHASWAGPALNTQSLCEVSVIGVAMYGRTLGGAWSKVGQTHLVGRWHPASTGGGFQVPASCEMAPASGEPALPRLSTGHAFTAVRTVGYGLMLFVPQRVTLGVNFGSGPC